MKVGPMMVIRDRARWASYAFIGGLLMGLILGWFFHRVVGTVIVVAMVAIPIVVVFLVWRRLEDRGRGQALARDDDAFDPIETRGEVVEYRQVRGEE